jgi:uncharacterized membrane protein
MILGRNPALWLAVVAATLNAAVVVFGIQLTAPQLAALNALAIAVVGVVANETDPTTVATLAPTTSPPPQSWAGSLSETDASPGNSPTPGPSIGAEPIRPAVPDDVGGG